MIDLDYKLATYEDLDAICILVRNAIVEMEKNNIFQWDDIYPTRIDFEEDIRNKNLFTVYDEGVLTAFYVISGDSDEQYENGEWEYDTDSAYILHRFCVSPAMQHKGIGKNVLSHIEKQVKDMGYESIRLDTFTENPYAQKLYRHNGYKSKGFATWRKGKFDLMEKKL